MLLILKHNFCLGSNLTSPYSHFKNKFHQPAKMGGKRNMQKLWIETLYILFWKCLHIVADFRCPLQSMTIKIKVLLCQNIPCQKAAQHERFGFLYLGTRLE